MSRRLVYTVIFVSLFIIMFFKHIGADTVSLKDGSLLVGKVIYKKKTAIIFKNSYGIFSINPEFIKKVYITQSYLEDVAVHKMLKQDYNEASIKKNYLSGLDKKNYVWSGGQLSADLIFLFVPGELSSVLPFGIALLLTYDQGLDFLFFEKRHFWMPGLRLETGYIHFENGNSMVNGFISFAGPLWYISILEKHSGRFFLSIVPGLAVLNIEKTNYHAQTTTFALHSCFGYEYSLGNVFFKFSIDNIYVYDRDIQFYPLGFRIGAGYELW